MHDLLIPGPLAAGQRVRVNLSSASPPTRTGRLVALTEDSLILARDSTAIFPDPGAVNGRLALSLDSVDAFGVSRGIHRNILPGGLVGGILGSLGGLAIICTRIHDCLGHRETDLPASQFSTILAASAVAGIVIGGAVGAFVRTEHWEDVPLNELGKRRVAPAPSAVRFQVGLSLFPAFLDPLRAPRARDR